MREFNYEIMDEIKKRWSPRAFSSGKIAKEDVLAVLEAARYAPSCFNEQPWKFAVGYEGEELSRMRELLYDSNKVWAANAPVLIAIITNTRFQLNQNGNFWAFFDAGTAWGYLSLEAQRRGLITHAMGGFNRKAAHQMFNLTEEYQVIAMVALGKMGDKSGLPSDLQAREEPATRKPISQLILKDF